jgi:hypothetical protein
MNERMDDKHGKQLQSDFESHLSFDNCASILISNQIIKVIFTYDLKEFKLKL